MCLCIVIYTGKYLPFTIRQIMWTDTHKHYVQEISH